jgi:probable HAF family extracellular repeat protein
MKRLNLIFALALVLTFCTSAFAQQTYSFRKVAFGDPNVSFTQLLGINNNGVIAGYHNFQQNQGFTLVLPNSFTGENFPNSMMTQVIGINNKMTTDGFYVDNSGITHGFFRTSNGQFTTVDFPGSQIATEFNQLLSQNDNYQAAGYYSNSIANTTPDIPYTYDEVGGVFHVIMIPAAVGGAQATGINNSGVTCGFFIDVNQVNHGWIIYNGIFMPLDVPGSTFTQALGLNNRGQVVGAFTDAGGQTHGFVYTIGTASYQTIDEPAGVGSTIVNGINDAGVLVGFYGAAPINTGFVATPTAPAASLSGEGANAQENASSGIVSEPPVSSPVAVHHRVPPPTTDDIATEPPVKSPTAINRQVPPATSDDIATEPPVNSPTAINPRVPPATADGVVIDPPVKSPIAVTREVAPIAHGVVVDPPVKSPVAFTRQVGPIATGIIVVDPPVNTPIAVNGR